MDRTTIKIEHLRALHTETKNKMDDHRKKMQDIQLQIWRLEAEEEVETRLRNTDRAEELRSRIADHTNLLAELQAARFNAEELRLVAIDHEIERLEHR